jgi:hypothetical protein
LKNNRLKCCMCWRNWYSPKTNNVLSLAVVSVARLNVRQRQKAYSV